LNTVKIDEIASEVANGIQPTGDKIFRVTKEIREKHSIEDSILKSVLVGSDFTRYSIPKTSHFVIYTTKETDISTIPNSIKYLSMYKDKLSQKRETKKGTLPWWCLHWPRFKGLFENPKIVLRQTSDRLIATFDDEGYYAMNNVIILQIPKDCKFNYSYLMCLLNSNVFNFIYQNITQEKDRAFAEVKPINIRKLPVKNISQENQILFTQQVDKMKVFKKAGKDTTELEREIDQLVYQLYDLTEEEIRIVEGGLE